MRQRHIEAFFAVMTYGTVTKAAARLGVSQPAVTTILRQAEKEAGFLLFQRRGGRLEPTAEARLLYEEVARAQASLSAIDNLCVQLRKGSTSQLRVASIQTFTETLIPSAIRRYVENQKACAVTVETLSSNRILNSLDLRLDQYDIGFIFGSGEGHSIYTVPITQTQITCVVPAEWRLPLVGGPVALSTLSGRSMIGLSEQEPVGQAARELIFEQNVSVEVRVTAQNHSLAGDLVAKGIGFALLDGIAARRLKRLAPKDVQVLPIQNAPAIPISAVLARAGNLTSAPRRFVEIFSECLDKFAKSVDA